MTRSRITLHPGDNRASLRRLIDQGIRVHSVCTDPPYGLVSVQKRFGKEGSKPARTDKNDGSFARLSGGFMGKGWDGTGIERDPEFWALIYEILLPGGYVFAFSGSRTGHWQACAMELAGFIMHPMHGWCFGSGFPKAHAADKAIDKALGKKGEVIASGQPVKRMIPGAEQHATGSWIKDNGREYQPGSYVPATQEAAEWEGWAYGTQAQKPALEPIYLGQKPFSEKTGAANLLKHGAGAVNIDGCRVPTSESLNGGAYAKSGGRKSMDGDEREGAALGMFQPGKTAEVEFAQPEGRHPANLILDGSSGVVAMFPAKAGAAAPVKGTEQSHTGDENTNCYGSYTRVPGQFFGASGSAARFFHQFPRYACDQCLDKGWTVADQTWDNPYGEQEECPVCEGRSAFLPAAEPLFYQRKAGKLDRAGSRHPTVKPIALMQYLIRHITPPGGTVLDPFAGSGTTAEAARREGFDCILMEGEPEYLDFLRQRFHLPLPVDDVLADLFNENKRGINSLQDDLDQGRSSTSGGQNREVQKSPTDFPDLMIEDCSSDDHGLAQALASNSSKKAFVPSRSAAGADLADLLF